MTIARRRTVLLDTGPIVATLDARDQWHRECAQAMELLADRCITTEAVVTEACYMIARGGARGALVIEFLLAAEIPVLGLELPALREAARLMDRYADVPMDFADASLVVLSHALSLPDAFTIDRRGFLAYRTARGAAFQLHPAISSGQTS